MRSDGPKPTRDPVQLPQRTLTEDHVGHLDALLQRLGAADQAQGDGGAVAAQRGDEACCELTAQAGLRSDDQGASRHLVDLLHVLAQALCLGQQGGTTGLQQSPSFRQSESPGAALEEGRSQGALVACQAPAQGGAGDPKASGDLGEGARFGQL